MTTIQIKNEDQINLFSKEKLTISLFELMCYIGEPNLKLAEKLASTIEDNLNNDIKKDIIYIKDLNFIIKEVLIKNNSELLQAFILKKNNSNFNNNISNNNSNLDLKYEFFKYLFSKDNNEAVDNYFLKFKQRLHSLNENDKDINNLIIKYINEGLFYPSTTILQNLNSDNQNLFSSYNLVIDDTLESIFSKLYTSATIEKRRSSLSLNIDNIRSKQEIVKSIHCKSCGPIKVIDLFNSATNLINYNFINNSNNLFYLNIENKDVFDFITKSKDFKKFNFVLLVPDRFIKNLINDESYEVSSSLNTNFEDAQKYTINPKNILDFIISNHNDFENIHLIFSNNLSKKNVFNKEYNLEISSVGLQPTYENNSFVSGVIDVSKFVTVLGDLKLFDWNKLKSIIMDSIIFLDNCIDNSNYINEDFENNIKNTRQIYLSITGFASLLYKLNIPYNSEDSLLFGEKLSEFISYFSKYQSMLISKTKGPFLKYIKSKYDSNNFSFKTYTIQKTLFSDQKLAKKLLANKPKIDWDDLKNNIKKYGIRNSTTYSILDSSMFCFSNNISNSINSIDNYKINYNLNNKIISKVNSEISYLLSEIDVTNLSEENIEDKIPISKKNIFKKSKDINALFYIKLQNAFEKYCDGTCNIDIYLDNKHLEDVKKLIIESYNLGNSLFSFKYKIEDNNLIIDKEENKKSI